MTIEEVIRDAALIEENSGLYNYKIKGISFWRILRFPILSNYLHREKKIGKDDTQIKKTKPKEILSSYFISLKEFYLLISKKRKVNFIIFAFPRLQKIDHLFSDKYTDPIIDHSIIKNDYCIFQRHQAGKHKTPRYHAEKVVKTDFIEITSIVLGVLLSPYITLRYLKKVFSIFKIARRNYNLSYTSLYKLYLKLGVFIASYHLHCILFKILKPKSILIVDREIFYPALLACKKLKIKTFELQHGVTHSWTMLYSCKYDPNLDPDYFLSFGEHWKGKQFGMPKEKIINIGWAFNKTIEKTIPSSSFSNNTFLVISEPALSSVIMETTILLASNFPEYTFHIRLHPQESLPDEMQKKLKSHKNIDLQDSIIESTYLLLQYKNVIGVRSTVLFDAISLNKKVGILNFNGCQTNIPEGKLRNVFKFINSIKDFGIFAKVSFDNQSEKKSQIYSEFKTDDFNKLIS